MGCGASKNDVIKSATSTGNEPKVKGVGGGEATSNGDAVGNGNIVASTGADTQDQSNNSSRDSLNSSMISEGSTIPANEKFGNGSATSTTGGDNNGNNNDILRGGSSSNRNLPELPPLKPTRTSKVGFLDQSGEVMDESRNNMPVAFEVPAEEDGSLIKKHPPRRLRQMEERPPEANSVTQEALEEKVALANERRNQVLHQRVASARQKSARAGRVRRPPMESELDASETAEGGIEGE